MRRTLMALPLLIAAAPAATPAAAQSPEGWTFAVSPYVWLPGLSTSIETRRGTVDVDTSASDAVSDLDFAFMGAAEARKGRWGLIADLIYSDISTTDDTPLGLVWKDADVDTRLTAFTLYASYRVYDDEHAHVDLLGGARFFSLSLDLSLSPGRAPGFDWSSSESWSNPVAGLRARYDFNDKWFATALGDMGGFAGDDSSWQLFGSVGYQFNPTWSVQGGWRYMDVEKDIEGRDVTIALNGPILGFTARF